MIAYPVLVDGTTDIPCSRQPSVTGEAGDQLQLRLQPNDGNRGSQSASTACGGPCSAYGPMSPGRCCFCH